MHHLYFYVPKTHAERVKQALFAVGAGRIGDYDCTCWQTEGTGQFRPLAGSQPHLGQSDQLETVAEYKVEMVCDDNIISDVIHALRAAHPYEEPAYGMWPIRTEAEI